MTQGIYAIVNEVVSRQYIGSSKDIEDRYKGHIVMLSRSRHDNRLLQAAWDKYGPEAFELVVVEDVEREEDLFVREQFYLDTIKNLYNMNKRADCPPSWKGRQKSPQHVAKITVARALTLAAQGGMSQETKDKIGRANAKANKGKKRTVEQLRSGRIARLGTKQISIIKLASGGRPLTGRTAEENAAIKKENIRLGNIKSANKRRGKHYHTSESKQKIGTVTSKYWKGRKKTPEHVLAATAGWKKAMAGKTHPLLGTKRDPDAVARSAKTRVENNRKRKEG